MPTNSFCTKCGCSLPEGVNYCPSCGTAVPGTAGAEEVKRQTAELEASLNEERANLLMLCLAVYIIPALIGAIILIADSNGIADTLSHEQVVIDTMKKYGLNIADLKNYVMGVGIITLISAIFAGVSLYFVHSRQKRIIATITCVIAAILCFWSFIGMFLGILVALLIFGAKPCFKDEPQSPPEPPLI